MPRQQTFILALASFTFFFIFLFFNSLFKVIAASTCKRQLCKMYSFLLMLVFCGALPMAYQKHGQSILFYNFPQSQELLFPRTCMPDPCSYHKDMQPNEAS